MDPAGGLAQMATWPFCLALDQRHLAGRGFGLGAGGGKAATGLCGVGDAPFPEPQVEVLGGAGALMHKIFRDIKADSPGADDHRTRADRRALQHVDIAQHPRAGIGRDAWVAGGYAGGDDHFVMAFQVGQGGGCVQAQVDACGGQHGGEPLHQPVEVLFSRYLLGQVQLAAHLGGGVEQRDRVAALRGDNSGHHACGTGPDHGDGFRCGGGRVGQFGFRTGAGVHEATGQTARKGMVQAGLVAGDAGRNLGSASAARLGDEIGVGEEGAGHADHIGASVGQDRFGHVGGVDPVRGDDRDPDFGAQPSGQPGEGATRNRGGNGRHPCLVPADACVQDRGARRLDGLGKLDHLGPGRAIGDKVDQRDPVDHDEIRSDSRAHAAHHLDRQADAVFIAAAPAILAPVGMPHDELIEEIPLGPHHLDAVISGLAGAGGGGHDIGDLLFDAVFVKFAGHKGRYR